MVSAMTEALSGTAGVGALTPSSARMALERLNTRTGGVAFVERMLTFRSLLDAIEVPGRMEWSQPLGLTISEIEDAHRLDGYRGDVEHPKATTWGFDVVDLHRVLAATAPITRRLIDAVPHHYSLDQRMDADRSVSAIRAAYDALDQLVSQESTCPTDE